MRRGAERKQQPKVDARPPWLVRWESEFQARVAKILPAMIRAETEKRATDPLLTAMMAAYPGAISESFYEAYKDNMRELIVLQQTSIAQGRVFRELFEEDMDLLRLAIYLTTQTLSPAWLVGFSNEESARRRYEQETRTAAAAQLRVQMSNLARRPRKTRRSKWPRAVHDEADACYKEWCEAVRKNRQTCGNLWGTTWTAFALICIGRIKKNAKIEVSETQLRRSILPTKDYPRPQ